MVERDNVSSDFLFVWIESLTKIQTDQVISIESLDKVYETETADDFGCCLTDQSDTRLKLANLTLQRTR